MEFLLKIIGNIPNLFCGKKRKRNLNNNNNNQQKDFIENKMYLAKNYSKYHNYRNYQALNFHSIAYNPKSSLFYKNKYKNNLMFRSKDRKFEENLSSDNIKKVFYLNKDKSEAFNSNNTEKLSRPQINYSSSFLDKENDSEKLEMKMTSHDLNNISNKDFLASIGNGNNNKNKNDLFPGNLSQINKLLSQEKSFNSFINFGSFVETTNYEKDLIVQKNKFINEIEDLKVNEKPNNKLLDKLDNFNFELAKKDENLKKINENYFSAAEKSNFTNFNNKDHCKIVNNGCGHADSNSNNKSKDFFFPEYYAASLNGERKRKYKGKIESTIFNRKHTSKDLEINIINSNSSCYSNQKENENKIKAEKETENNEERQIKRSSGSFNNKDIKIEQPCRRYIETTTYGKFRAYCENKNNSNSYPILKLNDISKIEK